MLALGNWEVTNLMSSQEHVFVFNQVCLQQVVRKLLHARSQLQRLC